MRKLDPSRAVAWARAIAWVEFTRCRQSTIWGKRSSEHVRCVYRPHLECARMCNGCARTLVVWRCYGRGMRAFAYGYCCRDHMCYCRHLATALFPFSPPHGLHASMTQLKQLERNSAGSLQKNNVKAIRTAWKLARPLPLKIRCTYKNLPGNSCTTAIDGFNGCRLWSTLLVLRPRGHGKSEQCW